MSLVLTTHIGFVTRVEHAPAVTEARVRASHLFSGRKNLSAVLHHACGAVLTHSLVQELLGGLVCAHVDGPGGDVAQQHGPEASVQAAHAVVPPDDAGGAGEALIYCARRPRVLPRAERALRLQAGFDDVERARHDARGDAGSGTAQCVDGPVGQAGDVHGETGHGRAPVGVLARHGRGPQRRGRIFSNDRRGRRLGVVRGHGMGCEDMAVRGGHVQSVEGEAYRPSSPLRCLSVPALE
jgi:hypothetical protein